MVIGSKKASILYFTWNRDISTLVCANFTEMVHFYYVGHLHSFSTCECTENIAKFEVVNIFNSNFTLESSSFRGNIGLNNALTV